MKIPANGAKYGNAVELPDEAIARRCSCVLRLPRRALGSLAHEQSYRERACNRAAPDGAHERVHCGANFHRLGIPSPTRSTLLPAWFSNEDRMALQQIPGVVLKWGFQIRRPVPISSVKPHLRKIGTDTYPLPHPGEPAKYTPELFKILSLFCHISRTALVSPPRSSPLIGPCGGP